MQTVLGEGSTICRHLLPTLLPSAVNVGAQHQGKSHCVGTVHRLAHLIHCWAHHANSPSPQAPCCDANHKCMHATGSGWLQHLAETGSFTQIGHSSSCSRRCQAQKGCSGTSDRQMQVRQEHRHTPAHRQHWLCSQSRPPRLGVGPGAQKDFPWRGRGKGSGHHCQVALLLASRQGCQCQTQ